MAFKICRVVSEKEKHACNVSVIKHVGKNLLSGSDDGIMKLWSPDLKLIRELDTKCGGILSLAVGSNAAFTCTSDETIQSWNLDTLQNIAQINSSLFIPQKLFYEPATNVLWIGDSQGRVAQFKDKTEINKFQLTEEIWDLYVTANPTLIFTARDRDVVISEVVTGTLRSSAVVKATVSGRYPLLVENDFMACLERGGRNIQVHENNIESKFKLKGEITASTMILNALCDGGKARAWAGGYEGVASLWDLGTTQSLGSLAIGSCVNALAQAETGVYAALADGRIVLVGQ